MLVHNVKIKCHSKCTYRNTEKCLDDKSIMHAHFGARPHRGKMQYEYESEQSFYSAEFERKYIRQYFRNFLTYLAFHFLSLIYQ